MSADEKLDIEPPSSADLLFYCRAQDECKRLHISMRMLSLSIIYVNSITAATAYTDVYPTLGSACAFGATLPPVRLCAAIHAA